MSMVKRMQGIEGQIELAGTRAVVAMFYRWTLEPRGATDEGKPRWSLRASFSYEKESLLTSDLAKRFRREIKIKLPGQSTTAWFLAKPEDGVEMIKDESGDYLWEGVTLWPTAAPR